MVQKFSNIFCFAYIFIQEHDRRLIFFQKMRRLILLEMQQIQDKVWIWHQILDTWIWISICWLDLDL